MKQLFLSPDGRIPRRIFWLAGFAYLIPLLLASAFFLIWDVLGYIAVGVVYIGVIWSSIILQIKRWHDRDKSGWWCLIAFVPIVGGLWVLIECGFLRGTVGLNTYGADPTDEKLL